MKRSKDGKACPMLYTMIQQEMQVRALLPLSDIQSMVDDKGLVIYWGSCWKKSGSLRKTVVSQKTQSRLEWWKFLSTLLLGKSWGCRLSWSLIATTMFNHNYVIKPLSKTKQAEEMAPWLKAFVLAEDLNLIPNIHTAVHNSPSYYS